MSPAATIRREPIAVVPASSERDLLAGVIARLVNGTCDHLLDDPMAGACKHFAREAEVGIAAAAVQGRALIEPVDARDFSDAELGSIYRMGIQCERWDIDRLDVLIDGLRLRDGDCNAGLVLALAAHDYGGAVLPLVRRVRNAALMRRGLALARLAAEGLASPDPDLDIVLAALEAAAEQIAGVR